jgi:hypothetical protein
MLTASYVPQLPHSVFLLPPISTAAVECEADVTFLALSASYAVQLLFQGRDQLFVKLPESNRDSHMHDFFGKEQTESREDKNGQDHRRAEHKAPP